MDEKSKSIQAIELTRTVFESVHGNMGLLKFNIEELTPKNGAGEKDSQRWEVTCSFYETIGSSAPSRYKVQVNLEDNTVSIKKVNGEKSKLDGDYTVVKKTGSDKGSKK